MKNKLDISKGNVEKIQSKFLQSKKFFLYWHISCRNYSIVLFVFEIYTSKKFNLLWKLHWTFSNVENFHRVKKSLSTFFECRKDSIFFGRLSGNISNVEKNQPSFLLFLRCGISSTLYLRGWIFSNSVWNFYDAIFCCRNFSVEIPAVEIFTLWNVEKILSWKKAPVEKIPSKLILFNLFFW